MILIALWILIAAPGVSAATVVLIDTIQYVRQLADEHDPQRARAIRLEVLRDGSLCAVLFLLALAGLLRAVAIAATDPFPRALALGALTLAFFAMLIILSALAIVIAWWRRHPAH